jgi:uncharacterized membrane protein YgcG
MSERDRERGGRSARGPIAWLAVAALAAVGCSARGSASGGPGGPGSGAGPGAGSGGVSGGAGASGTAGAGAPGVFAPASGALRRLTSLQYRNSISDLFGGAVTATDDLEADTALSGFQSIGASLVSLSPHLVEQLETSALDVAHQALSNTATRATFVGCNPTAATDDACTSAFLTKFGRRAWRRPLTADEVTTLATLTKGIQTSMQSYFGGLEYGVTAILESPHFLYREELGTTDPRNPARVLFDDHELATRLAYFLWNTTPDDALLDAADAKQLTGTGPNGSGFVAQAQRLLTSPRATAGAQTFFGEYFRLGDLDTLPQLPTTFPQATATIGPAMRQETQQFFSDLAITRDGDMRTMFTAQSTFVNGELASLYGLPGVTGTAFVPATLPANGLRAGYLGQGSFLALNAHSTVTSPTYRGKFIREMLMCETIPPPPMNVPPLPPDVPSAPQTMKQKLTVHRQNEPCATCHSLMDPLGLSFENFDGIGAFRTMDAGQVIDATGTLDGMSFNTPRDLETLLSQDPKTMACVARNLYRYVTGHIESGGEEPAITALVQAFSSGQFHFSGLVNGMLASAAFTTAAPPSNAPIDTSGGGAAGGSGTGAAGSGGSSGGAGSGGSSGGAGSSGSAGSPGSVPTGPISYATSIAPIIANKCSPCHTTQMAAGYNWSYDTLVTNSTVTNAATKSCVFILNPGKRVVAGDPDHSLLFVKINEDMEQLGGNHNCGLPMPNPSSGKTLTNLEIDTIRAWIRGGALP